MTPDIKKAEYVNGYKIHVWFENGRDGIVDFAKYINQGGIYSSLANVELFKKFTVDPEVFVLTWPNKADIAPEEIYSAATGESLPSWMSSNERYRKAS